MPRFQGQEGMVSLQHLGEGRSQSRTSYELQLLGNSWMFPKINYIAVAERMERIRVLSPVPWGHSRNPGDCHRARFHTYPRMSVWRHLYVLCSGDP